MIGVNKSVKRSTGFWGANNLLTRRSIAYKVTGGIKVGSVGSSGCLTGTRKRTTLVPKRASMRPVTRPMLTK